MISYYVQFCIEESVIKERRYFFISVFKYIYPFEDINVEKFAMTVVIAKTAMTDVNGQRNKM